MPTADCSLKLAAQLSLLLPSSIDDVHLHSRQACKMASCKTIRLPMMQPLAILLSQRHTHTALHGATDHSIAPWPPDCSEGHHPTSCVVVVVPALHLI